MFDSLKKTFQKSFIKNIKNVKKKFSFLKWIDPFTYVDLLVMPRVNPNDNSTLSWIVYIAFAAIFAFLIYNVVGLLLGTPYPFVIVVSGSMEPEYYRGDVIILQGINGETLNAPIVELNYPSLKNVMPYEYVSTYCAGKNVVGLMPCDYFKLGVMQKKISVEDFSVQELQFINGEKVNLTQEGAIVVYYSIEQQRPIIHRVVTVLKAKDGFYVLTKGDSSKNPLLDQDAGISTYAKSIHDLQGQAIFKIPLIGYVKLILIDDPMQLIFGCHYEEGCLFP